MYKVLIVDDCFSDIDGITKFVPWNELNCEVIGTARNGEEGYRKAVALVPDIIITDISMPITNGLDMTEKINKTLDNVRYIYISCHQSFDYAQLAIKNSACAYILKPIKIPELIEAVNKVTAQITKTATSAKLQAELYQQLLNNKDILLERYLTDLLLGFEHIDTASNFFEINDKCKYNICIIRIDNNDDFYADNDINNIYMQRIYLNTLISDKFDNIYQINFEQNQIVMLIPDTANYATESELDSIQEDFCNTFSSSFSAYITQDAYNLHNISEPFKNTLNMINNNYFAHKEQIIVLDKLLINSQRLSEKFDFSVLYKDVFDVINSETDINSFTEKYFSDMVINATYLKSLCYYIVNTLNIYLLEQNKTLSDVFEDEMIIWQKLTQFTTIVNIRQWVINIMIAVKQFINANKHLNNDKNEQIVINIKNYIDNNYSKATALEDSACIQNISLNYANTLFKKYENQTIFEYLIHKRFSEAKRLLATTSLKVTEIASMVGYTSNTYFSTAFKKETGLTPQSYRDKQNDAHNV